jgi:integrase
LGKNREWTEKYLSIQKLAWRMMKRERHSFHTFRRYIDGLKHFVKYMEVEDPDKALEKLRKGDPTKIVDGFIGWLTKKGFKPINIKSVYYAVRKFCVANEVKVEWDFIAKPKAVTKIKDRIPSVEELRTILNFTNIRDKALFMTILSSGLRVGTAMSLKIKDCEPIEDLAIIHVEGGEGRKLAEGFWYWTFITPETRKVVDASLEWRKRRGEKLTPESPLFAAIEKDAEVKYSTNISRQWRRLVEKAGLNKMIEGTGWLDIHLHVLRKFFHTKCKGAGIKPAYYDFWMGHTQGKDLADSYWREEIPEHLREYRKAIPDLSIFEKPVISEIEMRKKQIRDMAMLLFANEPEKLKALENLLQKSRTVEEVEHGLRNIMKVWRPMKKEESEEDCQRIIRESELPQWLKKGWKVQTVLPSGKIIISNE